MRVPSGLARAAGYEVPGAGDSAWPRGGGAWSPRRTQASGGWSPRSQQAAESRRVGATWPQSGPQWSGIGVGQFRWQGAVAAVVLCGLAAAGATLIAGPGRPELLNAETTTVQRASEDQVVGPGKDPEGCKTAEKGDPCYKKVRWAMLDGIHGHPEWYPGLTEHSSFGDFQHLLHHGNDLDCHEPCGSAFESSAVKAGGGSESCASLGCFSAFKPSRKCQCNSDCKRHNSCCADFEDACHPSGGDSAAVSTTGGVQSSTAPATPAPPTTTPYPGGPAPDWCYLEFNGAPSTQCFCKLAGNRGCEDKECNCPQGCGGEGITWDHEWSVSFKNIAKAERCGNPVALLTIPRSYFATVQELKRYCPQAMPKVLAEMLRGGFEAYQAWGGAGPVKHCIHAAHAVSQAWLHVHTICAEGGVDKMHDTNSVAWCGVMDNPGQADDMAAQIQQWSGELPPRPSEFCKDVGCGNARPKPFCSCNPECKDAKTCCVDYADACDPDSKPDAAASADDDTGGDTDTDLSVRSRI